MQNLFSKETVKMFTDLPLAIMNASNAPQSMDQELISLPTLLKYIKDGNLNDIKSLFESNSAYKTRLYLEGTDEVCLLNFKIENFRFFKFNLLIRLVKRHL